LRYSPSGALELPEYPRVTLGVALAEGDSDAAEKLKDAAYYGCGIIGQYQYGSKWDQAERELRNIANGVREEEQQRNRGLRR